MFYTIYKVTNKINNKTYIGKHQTKDLNDGYMGSGKLLKLAIQKHGIQNFIKEILHVFSTEKEMNLKEKELVVIGESSYNICEGGQGGWSYINRIGKNKKYTKADRDKSVIASKLKWKTDPVWVKERKIAASKRFMGNQYWLGRKHKEESKRKIGLANKKFGKDNSQYGTCWITNGIENRKIKKEQLDLWFEKGYNRGRI